MGLLKKNESISNNNTVKKFIRSKNKKNGDISKLESKIYEEQNEINEIYSQIGKLYYELYPNTSDENLLPLCNVVKESKRIIALCEKQKFFLQGIRLCQNCNAQLPLDSLYCNKCGAKIIEDGLDGSESKNTDNSKNNLSEMTIKCRECGSENTGDTVFCTNCGAKIR